MIAEAMRIIREAFPNDREQWRRSFGVIRRAEDPVKAAQKITQRLAPAESTPPSVAVAAPPIPKPTATKTEKKSDQDQIAYESAHRDETDKRSEDAADQALKKLLAEDAEREAAQQSSVHEPEPTIVQAESADAQHQQPQLQLQAFFRTDPRSLNQHEKELTEALHVVKTRFPDRAASVQSKTYKVLARSAQPAVLAASIDPDRDLPVLCAASSSELDAYQSRVEADRKAEAAAIEENGAKLGQHWTKSLCHENIIGAGLGCKGGAEAENTLKTIVGMYAVGIAAAAVSAKIRADEIDKLPPAERAEALRHERARWDKLSCHMEQDRQRSFGNYSYSCFGVGED